MHTYIHIHVTETVFYSHTHTHLHVYIETARTYTELKRCSRNFEQKLIVVAFPRTEISNIYRYIDTWISKDVCLEGYINLTHMVHMSCTYEFVSFSLSLSMYIHIQVNKHIYNIYTHTLYIHMRTYTHEFFT